MSFHSFDALYLKECLKSSVLQEGKDSRSLAALVFLLDSAVQNVKPLYIIFYYYDFRLMTFNDIKHQAFYEIFSSIFCFEPVQFFVVWS